MRELRLNLQASGTGGRLSKEPSLGSFVTFTPQPDFVLLYAYSFTIHLTTYFFSFCLLSLFAVSLKSFPFMLSSLLLTLMLFLSLRTSFLLARLLVILFPIHCSINNTCEGY